MATDLTISVEDRPGALADVGEALGEAGINIEGVCAFGMEGRGIVHVCVEDASAARRALDGAGIKVEGEADAILTDRISGAGEAGTLGRMTRRVADAGVNLRVVYVATGDRGVIVAEDNAAAMRAMG